MLNTCLHSSRLPRSSHPHLNGWQRIIALPQGGLRTLPENKTTTNRQQHSDDKKMLNQHASSTAHTAQHHLIPTCDHVTSAHLACTATTANS